MSPGGSSSPRRRLAYVMPGAALASLIAAALGIFRLVSTGGSTWVWAGVVFLLGAPMVAVLAYGRLRTANAMIWVEGDRIGVSNALGVRRDISLDDAKFILLCSVQTGNRTNSMRCIFVVDGSGRARLRFYGAEALQPGGVARVSEATHLPLRGSWDESWPLDRLKTEFPGAVSMNLALFGYVAEHRNLVYWAVWAGTFVIGAVALVIYIVVSHP